MQILAIAIGGALGALGRYFVGLKATAMLGKDFPYATMVVNVAGSLIIGFVFAGLLEKVSPEWRSFLVVGFLGSFTTFSTFSADAMRLFEAGQTGNAILYIAGSLLLGLVAFVVGGLGGKMVF